jgi:glutathione synthase/RimK-type ligase-like ATP-grasp enzyme
MKNEKIKNKIAIHHRQGSYSERWIEYCEMKKVAYTLVNCYDTDIIDKIQTVKGLLWHWHHENPEDLLVATHVIGAAEKMGLKVYPSISSCWHFDNKIAQKYLLESIKAPLIPTHVFLSENEAIEWIKNTTFPKVFKLSKGASARNVILVKNAEEAIKLAQKAFKGGFKPLTGYAKDIGQRIKRKRSNVEFIEMIKRMPGKIRQRMRSNKLMGRECGYIYFQDFIPDNKYDIRVDVIGKRIFAYTRNVRNGDFRASGSKSFNFDMDRIPMDAIKIAYKVSQKIGAQSLAFDFVKGANGEPQIIEISYCFGTKGLNQCQGYYDENLIWHSDRVRAEDAILEDFLGQI